MPGGIAGFLLATVEVNLAEILNSSTADKSKIIEQGPREQIKRVIAS
jgi:hypothetical protein